MTGYKTEDAEKILHEADANRLSGNYQKACELYEKIIAEFPNDKQTKAYYGLALICDSLNDYRAAFLLWQKAADAGDIDAQYNLAMYYHYGLGTAENTEKAIQWFKKAASAGHQKSAYCLKLFEKR